MSKKVTGGEMLNVFEALRFAYWNPGKDMPKPTGYQEFINIEQAIRRLIESRPKVSEKKLLRVFNAIHRNDPEMSFGIFLKSLELLGVEVEK